ncbi:cuticle protein 65-like [Prorops nasuta]|uniref:cuticle protein 65-like n=1 Tax=Prorops nasuta TaxID=863751 RepID=UPI0034CD1799
MNSALFVLFTIFALTVPAFGQEAAVETKKQEKRGILGLGYAGYGGLGGLGLYGGYGGFNNGLNGLGYGGLDNGYLAASSSYPAYSYGHTISAPVLSASLPTYSHGYNAAPLINRGHNAPVYSSPLRLGIGYSGLNLGHGLGYLNGY